MRKLVVGTFVSLDGVMQAPGGPDEDRGGGFEHGGWLVPYFDEQFAETMSRWTQTAGGFLLGRKTYEIFAASWPNADPDDSIAAVLNQRPKYVASRTLDHLDWSNSTLLQGDVAEAVRRLKDDDGGEIQVHGSATLAQSLAEAGLVDRYHLLVFPLVLGGGKRLFAADGADFAKLDLVDQASYANSIQKLCYDVVR
jgi:dihydrofolate reductase